MCMHGGYKSLGMGLGYIVAGLVTAGGMVSEFRYLL